MTEEVSALIATLHETQHRLEVLTQGEVDSVSDRDGRTFLLRRAQDRLRHSEAAKQAGILNALPAHIALLDRQGVIVSVNEAWKQSPCLDTIPGPGHAVGSNYPELCDSAAGDGSAEAHEVAAGVRSVLAGAAKNFSTEFACHLTKQQRWLSLTVTPLAEDQPGGAIVMLSNITERKRSDEELRRFGAAMDATADAIYLVDRESMSFVHVNEAACRMQDLTREQLLAVGPGELLAIPRAELERTYDALIASGVDPEPLEMLRTRKDGSRVWVELRRHAVRVGSRWKIVTVVRDVTESKSAKDALKRAALELQRFRAAMEISADAIALIDRTSMRYIDVNARLCEMAGRTRQELIGLTPMDVMDESRANLERAYDEVISDSSAAAAKVEGKIVGRDGRTYLTETRRRALHTENGWIIVGIVRDITAQKQAEIRITRLNRVYAVLSGINTLIVRVREREELFREACRIAVEQGRFQMAWIAVVDRVQMKVVPVASAGAEADFMATIGERFSLQENSPDGNTMTVRAVRGRKAMVSNDIVKDAVVVFGKYHLERGTCSMAILPLLVAGKAVGVLALYSNEVGFFDDEELTLLTELAGDIAFAMDHIKKAKKLARMTRVNAVLSDINAAIVRIRDRQGLFDEVCRIAVETGGLPFAWICLVDEKEMRLRLAASAGADASFLETIGDRLSLRDDAPAGHGLGARSVREKTALAMNDAQKETYAKYRATFAERGIRSTAAFPLIIAGKAVGTLALHSAEAGFFDEDEMKLLGEVAANIAFALEDIEKEANVQRLTRVYAVLSGVNSAIVRIQERDELCKEVCRIAVADGGFTVARVVDLDSNGTARVAASTDFGMPLFQRVVDEYNGDPEGSQNLLAIALRSGQPLISDDVANDIRMPNRAALTIGESFALALFPIIVERRVAGMIVLRAREAGMFDETEMRLLTELTSNVALAIDHIGKAEKLGRVTRVNAILSGINGAIVQIRDRDKLFQAVCRIAVETGGLPFCWLCMVDDTGEQLKVVGYAGPDDGFLEMIADRLSLRNDAPIGFGISARSVRESRAITVGDVSVGEQIKHKKPYADRGIKSTAAFPLLIRGRAIGSFSLNAAEIDFFDNEEMKLLEEVAGNIAFALENIEKEDKVQRLTRVYAVSSGITSLIVHVDNREELFREACRIAVEHGHFAMSWIGAFDPATQDVTPVAWAGEAAEELTRVKSSARDDTPAGAGAVGQSIRARRPIFNNNILTQAFGGPRLKEIIRLGFQSHITLPLYENQAIVATLTLYTKERGYFDEDEVRLLTGLAADISFALENLSRQHKLDYLAYYDELTGLANRSLFLERLSQHMRSAVSRGHKLALFFLDLERFRNINDSLGRPAGDALLKQVAEWLSRNVGDATLLARLGGDHFAIVLPEVKQESGVARLLDKRIREFFDHSFRVNDTEIRLAAKVGVALFPNDGADAETLLSNAEAALKNAKPRGDRILFYTQAMNEAVADNLTLENQLRRALENEEFVLHYQPKISLDTGLLTSAEALIRWHDPRTGLVPPGRFIPILEETGLIHDAGRWALRKAIAEFLRWRAAGLRAVRIAVNVSPLQLRNRNFIAEVQQAIGIDPAAAAGLELEITESLIMEDVKHSIATLKAIRAMGVTIAIDDFGTGFSSLSYIAKLPVDTLKIDRSFVIDMMTSPQGLALVSTIINLAHSLKLKVVAEGVETEEQSRLLRLLRCDEMQGFLFSKAVPGNEFEARFLAAPVTA